MTAANELLIDEEDQLYKEYRHIYDRLMVTRDLANWDDALLDQMEELELAVDLELNIETRSI